MIGTTYQQYINKGEGCVMALGINRCLFRTIMAVVCIFGMTGNAVAEEVKIGTGAAATENIFNKIKDPMEKANGVKLVVISGGPVQALKDLDAGTIDGAVGGVTFPDWMAMMEKEGYPIADKSVYKNRVIGKDVVKVMTNKDVTVSALSKEQLTGIFSGKTKNWSEVGGPDKPVVLILGTKIPGTQSVFQKQILNGEAYATGAVEGTTAEDLKARVIANPGGISLAAMAQIDGTVNGPAIPEVGRPITLITKGPPSGGLQKMLDYISGPGQQLILK
jgi:phosphate transport system substrate-binding protein